MTRMHKPTHGTFSLNCFLRLALMPVLLVVLSSAAVAQEIANVVAAEQIAAGVEDTDGDGITDDIDNCTLLANPSQLDTDGDCFGNRCDADLNNDGIVNSPSTRVVNAIDLGIFRTLFHTEGGIADFNGDGYVNSIDLGILRTLFFQGPGPAANPWCANQS